MGDDILRTGSSLSEIINKQHKANISCEESQTLFDYYVSTLQANFKAPLVAKSVHNVRDASPKDPPEQEDLFPIVDEEEKFQFTDFGNEHDIVTSRTLPLADVSRKRQRYQSPLETIEECDLHIQEQHNVDLRREPERQSENSTSNSHGVLNSAVTTRQNGGNRFRSRKEKRNSRSDVQMLYQTEVWTQEDENDRFCVENKLLLDEENRFANASYKKYDILESKSVTNSIREAHQSYVRSEELASKIASIEGKPTESCTADQSVRSFYITNAEDDGAISVMSKLSVVDIHSYHARSHSQRVKVNSAVCPDLSALQEIRSLQDDSPSHDNECSDSVCRQVDTDVDTSGERGTLQQHTRRKDADKHIEMVKEKQQKAKELFSKLKSIEDVTVDNIAYNSLMVLEASIKKCALLSRSTSFEPEEVIKATTLMLNELTNLITTTSNKIRQVEKVSNTEGENLNLEPFLSGPRSISSLFSSTETLMSPVKLSSSSFEMDNGANLFTKQAMREDASPATVTINTNESAYSGNEYKPPNLKSKQETHFSSDYEYEIVKSVDLISFVDDQNVMAHSYQQLNETRPHSSNIMDAELEELPGWQKNNNLIGAGELLKQWEGDKSRTSEHVSSMEKSSINNQTTENFRKATGNAPDRIQVHSTSCTNNATPVTRRPKSRNRNVMRPERDVNPKGRTAPCGFSQSVTQPNKSYACGQARSIQQERQGNKHKPLSATTGMPTREFRKPSPRRETNVSDTRAVDKNQRRAPTGFHEQRVKKESYAESGLRSPNKQMNQQGQLARQPSVQAKNEQKRKSNTFTLRSKETKNVLKTSTVKDMTANKLTKQGQLSNKTLERNLSTICDKISALKSCVADSSTCFENNVTVGRCVVETNVGDKLPFSTGTMLSAQYNLNNKGHTNRTEFDITEKSMKPETGSNANSHYVTEIQQDKPGNNNTKGVFRNTQAINYPNRLKPPGSHPGVQKETSRRTNVLSSNYLGYANRSKYDSTQTAHRDSDSSRKPTSINSNETRTTNKSGLSSSFQKKSVFVDKGNRHSFLQTKRENPNVRIPPESKRHPERPKRLLTHQEIQEWVNFNHQQHHSHGQRCFKHATRTRKKSASPNRKKSCPFSGGSKSAREIPRRVQSASPSPRSRGHSARSKRTKCSIERDHVSDTSLSDLLSIHSSPYIERTASQLIMDSLTDTVEFGLNRCLSSKPNSNLEQKFKNLCENTAKEIVSKMGSCDAESSSSSSSVHATINHLVKSLDHIIHARSDKRVCWDSSTDTPPRCMSAPEETQLEIVDTGSRVLETITKKLIRKLSCKSSRAGCQDDPETEVSYNSKRSGAPFSSVGAFHESDLGCATSEQRRACHKAAASGSRMPANTHEGNLNTLLDVLKSTSDGKFSDRCTRRNHDIPSGVAEATHAMAALEDLQALLSSLKDNMNEQSRSRAEYSPVPPPMTPFPSISNITKNVDRESDSRSNDPETTIETHGDTTIITMARAPVKRPPKPTTPQPVHRLPSSLFTKYSPRTVSSNTSTVRTSTNSTRSCSTSGSFDRSTISNCQAAKFQRPQSISPSCRSGNTQPLFHANTSVYSNSSEQQTGPRQSPPPRRSQNHAYWLNRKPGVSSSIQTLNSTTRDCSNNVSENASVRSSSSHCTSRVYQLAQPKKRYLEATKSEYQNVLRQPYLERLNKRIRLAETQITSQTPHKEMKSKFPARKRPQTIAERTDRKFARMMKYCPDDDNKEEKTLENIDDNVQETISTSSEESEIDEPLSIHYNSPSDESQMAAINDREYYHYSDRSDYSASALNTVEFGGIVYVGVEKKSTRATSEELVDNDATMHEQNQNNNFINIDMDTWNIITENCIQNFKQEEQTLIFQTTLSPPKHNEVTISELTGSQEDFLSTSIDQATSDHYFEVPDLEDTVNTTQPQSYTLQEMVSSVPSTLMNETYSATSFTDLCFNCCTESLVKYDPILPTSELANDDDNYLPSKEENLSTTGKEYVENIVFEVMEDILNKVTVLSMVHNRSCPPSSNADSHFTDESDESTATDSESTNEDVTAGWAKLNHLPRRKTYHPKQSIPDEIAIALHENYDPNIFFDFVKQYLSSESETESLNTEISQMVEVEEKQLVSHVDTVVDWCGLYETFSEDSSSEETSEFSTHQSISIYRSSENSSSSMLEAVSLDDNNANMAIDCVVTNGGYQTANTLHNHEHVELSTWESERDTPTAQEHHTGTLKENVIEVTDCGTDHDTVQHTEYNTEHQNESKCLHLTKFTASNGTLNDISLHTKRMDEYQNGSQNTHETKCSNGDNCSKSLSETKCTSGSETANESSLHTKHMDEYQNGSQNTSKTKCDNDENFSKSLSTTECTAGSETVNESSLHTKHMDEYQNGSQNTSETKCDNDENFSKSLSTTQCTAGSETVNESSLHFKHMDEYQNGSQNTSETKCDNDEIFSKSLSTTQCTAGNETVNESSLHTKHMDGYQNGSQNTSETKSSKDDNFSQSLSQNIFTSRTRTDEQNKAQADWIVKNQSVSQDISNSQIQEQESAKVSPQINGSNSDLVASQTYFNYDSITNNINYQNTADSLISIDDSTCTTKSTTVYTNINSNQDMHNKTHHQSQIPTQFSDSVTQENERVTSQHDSITNPRVEHEHILSEGQLETGQEPSSGTEHATGERQPSAWNLALETILPPNSSLVPPSVNNTASVLDACSVSSILYHSMPVSDVSSEGFPAHPATCVILPVLDITTAGTVRELLGALTHVTSATGVSGEDTEVSDTTTRSRSMETLLKQFSAVAIPGVQEQCEDAPQDETLDSILESLSLLPEPMYYGLYSTSTVPLSMHRVASIENLVAHSSPLDLETLRSDSNVQTDDAHINWPQLSADEIRHGASRRQFPNDGIVVSLVGPSFGLKAESDPGLGNRLQDDLNDDDDDIETCTSVSSPGLLLFNVETIDLPYVGEAERQSLMDLAIYTDILKSYSSRERIAELMSSLDSRELTKTTAPDTEPVETLRKVVIMSIAYFLVTFIMLGVFTLPHRCE